MDIPTILTHTRPGDLWELNGDAYDGLIWHSDTPKPTEAELAAAWPEVQAAQEEAAAAKVAARDAALAKLAAIGLTVDDLTALGF